MDDLKKIIYGMVAFFAIGMVVWLGFIFVNSCGLDVACAKAKQPQGLTPIPSLIPATLPASQHFLPTPTEPPTSAATEPPTAGGPDIARPSNPGGPGDAINLKGDVTSGAQLFAADCVLCHGLAGVGDIPNPGTDDVTTPPLNPIDDTLKDPDYKTYALNLDLFIQHGSTPPGINPTFKMPAWGDIKALTQQQIADIIAYLISLNP